MAIALDAAPPRRRDDFGGLASIDGLSFGALLRRYRHAAGLSQEALADRANLSVRAVNSLERGERQAPYRGTVGALVSALGLSGSERAALEAAVSRTRGPRATTSPVFDPVLTGLPLAPAPLIDRTVERTTAQDLLRLDAVRLLTVTGPGGVGKTRLALEVARDLQDAFPDGVWFVDLAPLRSPDLVLSAIAGALNVHEHGRQSLLATLQAYLLDLQVLLVLDNFEQVLAAAPQLASLLAACPELKLLVTSRSRLRLRWEHTLPLTPLPVPDLETPLSTEALAACPAVALFVERTRASCPAFSLNAANAPAIAALCRHLEGLPLALELAAARANVLSPAEMLSWAEQRLPVLGWDAPDIPSRQQSLRATLAWSYALLPSAEQVLFRRLAVFADGWTREAAEAITGSRELGLDSLEGLTRLSDASLVQVRPGANEEPRFGLLETVREFALEQLQESGEQAAVERQHAGYYLALAEHAAPALEGPEQRVWFRRLQQEHGNLRTALGWAAQQDEAEIELRLASCLAYVWWTYGYWREGREWLADALARNPNRRDGLQAQALQGLGLLMTYLGEFDAGMARVEEAVALARELGDERGLARALGTLSIVAYIQGQTERWPALAAELDAALLGADLENLNIALHAVGMMAHEAGEHAQASAYLEEALAVGLREGNQFAVAVGLGCLALVAQAQGNGARAVELATESMQHVRELGFPLHVAFTAFTAAQVSAEWAPEAGLARVLGAIDPLGPTARLLISPYNKFWYRQTVARLHAALSDAPFDECWATGRAFSAAQLADEALGLLAAYPVEAGGADSPPEPARAKGLLSPREHEVLGLVAEGMSNREIAERLVISESTTKYHLTSLFNKLVADNRTQAVTQARHQGLL